MLLIAAAVTAITASADAGTTDQVEEPRALRSNVAQVGFALAAETVVSPGSVCPKSSMTPCILGSGGGLAIRFGELLRPALPPAGRSSLSLSSHSHTSTSPGGNDVPFQIPGLQFSLTEKPGGITSKAPTRCFMHEAQGGTHESFTP